jgi:Gpi18-like mannosyltransferase
LKSPLTFTKIAKVTVILGIVLIIVVSALNFPDNQLVTSGFDKNLVDIDRPSGVNLSSTKLTLTSKPNQIPYVTTITTSAAFNVTLDVTVIEQGEGSFPVQIGVWDPISADTFSVVFSYPDTVLVGTRNSSNTWETFLEMGKYSVNSSYSLSVFFRPNSSITFSFSNSTWSNVTSFSSGSILLRPMVNLVFFSSSPINESVAAFENYRTIIPTQSYYSYFVGSMKNELFILYFVVSVLAVFAFRTNLIMLFKTMESWLKRGIQFVMTDNGGHKLVVVLLFSLLLQIALSTLGSHPYDMFTEKIWAYTESKNGLSSLYPVSLIVPSGRARFDSSIINSYFPYPPLLSYQYLILGKAYSFFSPQFNFNSPDLSFLLKFPSFMVTLIVTCLIYFFIRKKVSDKVAIVFALFFSVMPGLIFDTAIWGQPDIYLILLIISSILTFSVSLPASLFFLIVSLLTKQTAVFPAAFIFILILKKYGLRKTIGNIMFPISCAFLVLLPFLFSGYSPFYVVDVSIGNKVFNIASQNALGVPDWIKTVSGGAHNIWPLITSVFNNQTGYSRFSYSDSGANQVIGFSYVQFGLYLTLGLFILILVLALLSLKTQKKNEIAQISYFTYLSVFAIYLFSTRMHERYLFLTVPLLILAFPWIKFRKVFAGLCVSLSATFFLSIYSIFTLAGVWVPQSLPNFLPTANPINGFAYSFVSNDFSITVLCLANVLIFTFSLILAVAQILIENRQNGISHTHRNLE